MNIANKIFINKFYFFILLIQLIMFSFILCDQIKLHIPILRQIIGFIYIVVIPGLLVINIIKLKKLKILEYLLIVVGIGLFIIIFLGLLIAILYPYFGISNPISLIPLIITFGIFNLLLTVLSFLLDYKQKIINKIQIDHKNLLAKFKSPQILGLLLLPFLSIFGTYFVNHFANNSFIFVLLILISLIPIYVLLFNINENIYPLIIFIIAISLLYHWSLISLYITGADIHHEYYYANLLIENGFWDGGISNNVNAVLSIVILAPILSYFLNLDIVWIFKIIYPLIYALTPVGLYSIFKNQINSKISFLSVYYFMVVFPFFSEMLQLARQEIAEFFLMLLIFILINTKIDKYKKSFLLIAFGISLTVSHYGLSYIFLFSLISIWIFSYILQIKKIKSIHNIAEGDDLPIIFLTFYSIFTISWYMYISNSSSFNSLIRIIDTSFSSYSNILNIEYNQGLAIIQYNFSYLHEITKYLYLISQLLICIGLLYSFFNYNKFKFIKIFYLFSFVYFGICIACFIIPYFASSMNTTRFFHISLFFLAPFCVLGVIGIFSLISKIMRYTDEEKMIRMAINSFSLFLMIFFLFTSGLIYEIGNDKPVSIALNSTYEFPRFNEKELNGATWTTQYIHNSNIYSDQFSEWMLKGFLSTNFIKDFSEDYAKGYLYLRETNLKSNTVSLINRKNTLGLLKSKKINDYSFYKSKQKIFSNNGSEIWIIT